MKPSAQDKKMYGAVPNGDEGNNHDVPPSSESAGNSTGCSRWFWHFLEGGDLTHDQKESLKERLDDEIVNVESFCIHAESVRIIAYTFFV